MYILKTKAFFDSAHFLKGYEGRCSNIHGHRWRVDIEVFSETLEESGSFRGMVVDFGKLKDDLKDATAKYDHVLIYEKGSLKAETVKALNDEDFSLVEVDFVPTAENFAKHFADIMSTKGYNVEKCTVYETPDNSAVYIRRD